MSDGRFQKGHVPKNKGKKLEEYCDADTIQRIKKTQFTKGHIPKNARFDGAERLDKDGYRMVRISLGKWKLLHRHNWEQVNGEIPKGMTLVSKDGNKLNCDADNWELITMAENMRRNTIHKYPKEIALAVQMIGVLNRQINKKK